HGAPAGTRPNAQCGTAAAACAARSASQRCDNTAGRCVASGMDGGTGCTWSGGPGSNSGELTCYWFSQGTAQGMGCPSYKTYCGYSGTQSGSGGGLLPSGGTEKGPNTATSPDLPAL